MDAVIVLVVLFFVVVVVLVAVVLVLLGVAAAAEVMVVVEVVVTAETVVVDALETVSEMTMIVVVGGLVVNFGTGGFPILLFFISSTSWRILPAFFGDTLCTSRQTSLGFWLQKHLQD